MKKYLLLLFVLSTSFSSTFAKKIPFNFDFSQYANDSSSTLLEFSYSFPDTSLMYAKNPANKYSCDLYLSIELSDNIKTVASKEWKVGGDYEAPRTEYKDDFFGIKYLAVPPGQYTIRLFWKDLHDSTSCDSITNNTITIKKFESNRIEIGGPSIIYSANPLKAGEEKSQFARNGLMLIPNPKKEICDTNNLTIKLYSEIYNAKNFSPSGVIIKYKIYDGAKRIISEISKKVKQVGDAFVDLPEYDVFDLPTGAYTFESTILYPLDAPTDSVTSIKKVFYLINKNIPPAMDRIVAEEASFSNSEFATMTEEQVKDIYQKSKIIATVNDNLEVFESLTDLVAKQKKLFEFWHLKNMEGANGDPNSNAKYEQFKKNIDLANKDYGYMKIPGWKTDRGRILIKYGEPTSIDRSEEKQDQRAYQKWHYDELKGGTEFDFVEMSGGYRLVNSTLMGEHQDDNWYNKNVIKQNTNYNGTNQ